MQRGGLGARNRRVRRVVLALDPLDAHRRVDERLDGHVRKRRQKRRALGNRLRVRVDLPQARQRHVLDADQAQLDAQHFLADNREIGVRQRVVRVVHRPRGRVLDRQHRVVRGARPHFLEDAAERRQAPIRRVRRARSEELPAGDVAERAFRALEDHRDRPRRIVARMARPEVQLLRADREVDELAEHPDDEQIVESLRRAPAPQAARSAATPAARHATARPSAISRPRPASRRSGAARAGRRSRSRSRRAPDAALRAGRGRRLRRCFQVPREAILAESGVTRLRPWDLSLGRLGRARPEGLKPQDPSLKS